MIIQIIYGQDIQEKHQRAKINYNQSEDLTRLESFGIPVDHGVHKKGVFIISDFSISEIQTARNAGYTVDILIEDSKEYFLQRNSMGRVPERNISCTNQTYSDYQTPDNFNLGSMGGYLTYQEMLDELDLMKSLYPDLITTKENISDFITEGQPDNSTTPPIGGNGIKWVKISDNPNTSSENEPQILYTAIHHAREPNSLSQLIFYMWYLLENYEFDNEIKSIVDNTELFFVPVINPDGYLYNEKTDPNGGGYWRKNRKNGNGVDNNRNYDYYINGDPANGIWGGEGASNDPNNQTYHGTAPFSEVENQAVKWFCEQHDFIMAFNNHSYGNLLLYPYGYTNDAPTPENELFEAVSEVLVSQNGFDNILSSGLYPAAGDSDDFMYGTVGTHDKIYAMTPEIGAEFWPPSNQIEGIAKSMMYLNITSAKMVNNYAALADTSPLFVGDDVIIDQTFNLKRLGISGSGNFTISINPVSTNISAVGDPILFSNLDVLEETNGTIQYILMNETQAGDPIAFEIIVNNGSYDTIILLNKIFGNLIPVFEDLGDSTTDNFDNNGWDSTNATYVSPTSSITESPNGNYQNNESKTITLLENINLILRNGDIVNELRDEVRTYSYDLTIIGGSGKRSLAHDFIQYIESSILIVNNFNLEKKYSILLAVDDSPGTEKAVKYGVRVAQAFNIKIDIITISKDGHFGEGYSKAVERTKKMMRRCNIETKIFRKVGDPVQNIVETAGENHIIIMGASTQSPITKFFIGSKPLNVIEKSNCPVLIVK